MNKIIVLFVSIFVVSCGVQKKTTTMDAVTKENIAELLEKEMPYSQIKISGNVKLDIEGKYIPSVKLTIYNERSQKIWMNGQVAILNAGRALATPEKFEAYEKLNKTYIDEDYDFINNLLGVNFIDYESLEKLLLGKPFTPINWKKSKIDISEEAISIKSLEPITISMDGKVYEYFVDLHFDGQLNLSKVLVEDKIHTKGVEIIYQNHTEFNNMMLPKLVNINVIDTKPKNITLEYNNFDNQKMETPFNIPSGYKKRTIK